MFFVVVHTITVVPYKCFLGSKIAQLWWSSKFKEAACHKIGTLTAHTQTQHSHTHTNTDAIAHYMVPASNSSLMHDTDTAPGDTDMQAQATPLLQAQGSHPC